MTHEGAPAGEAAREAALLDRLFETALDPQQWQGALAPLAEILGGGSAWLSRQDLRTGAGSGHVWGMDESVQDSYFRHFIRLDQLSLRGLEMPQNGPVLTDEHRVPRQDLERSAFFNDFMRQAHAHSILMIDLGVDAGTRSVIHINRPRRLVRFGRAEMDRAARLLPQLKRAMRVSNAVGEGAKREAMLSESLDALPAAIFLLDAGGRLEHANQAGLLMLTAGDVVVLNRERMGATDPASAARLDALVRQAAAAGADRRSGTMMLGRAQVSVTPMAMAAASRIATMVCIHNPAGVVTAAKLRNTFHLTTAEAGVGMLLLEGLTPKDVAQRLGVQLQTVRNQMRRVFEKTRVSRQSEFIRLMMTASF